MAGVKGRSGGARPGAGRKPKAENAGAKTMPAAEPDAKPLDVLLAIMRDPNVPVSERRKAAKDAAPYVHPKAGEQNRPPGEPPGARGAGWDDLLQPGAMQ